MKEPQKISNIILEDFTSFALEEVIEDDASSEILQSIENDAPQDKFEGENVVQSAEPNEANEDLAENDKINNEEFQNGYNACKAEHPLFANNKLEDVEHLLRDFKAQLDELDKFQKQKLNNIEDEIFKISSEVMQNFIPNFEPEKSLLLKNFWNETLKKIDSESEIEIIISNKFDDEFLNKVKETVNSNDYKGNVKISSENEDNCGANLCKIVYSNGEINFPNAKNELQKIFDSFLITINA